MKQLKLLFLCINYFFLVYIQTTLPMYLLLFPSVSFLFVNLLIRYYRYLFFLKMSLCRGTLRPPSCRFWWLGTRLTRESSAKTTSSNQRLSVPSTRSPGFFFFYFFECTFIPWTLHIRATVPPNFHLPPSIHPTLTCLFGSYEHASLTYIIFILASTSSEVFNNQQYSK